MTDDFIDRVHILREKHQVVAFSLEKALGLKRINFEVQTSPYEDLCRSLLNEINDILLPKANPLKKMEDIEYTFPNKSKNKEIKRKKSKINPETINRQSIANKRFQEYLMERENELEYHLLHKFKAKPAPETTKSRIPKGLPNGEIVEQRRKSVKPEKPSLFLVQTTEADIVQFKANPLDRKILEHSISEKESKRESRIKERARKLLEQAELPRRMKNTTVKRPVKLPIFTFTPKICHDIPDFKVQYEEFMAILAERKRKAQIKIPKSRPFRFHGKVKPVLKESNKVFKKKERKADVKPVNLNKNTFSNRLRIEYIKRIKDEKSRTEKEQREAIRKRKQREKEISKRIKEAIGNIGESTFAQQSTEIILQAKLNAKEQTASYKAKLDEMDDKLKQRKKLIFERDQERRTKNDAHQYFKEILAKNGLYIETLQDKQRIYS